MNPQNQIVIFDAPDHPVQVRLEGETIWLTQRQMADVFATTPENVQIHLKNIFREGEVEEAATAKEILAVQIEGSRRIQRRLKHYSLDAVISVGYRVNSSRATRFRQWATRVLREHLTQGYSLDRSRFDKNAAELEAALPSRPSWAIWNSRRLANRPTRALRARRHTCCISSSRTTPSPTATSAAGLSCSWISWRAMVA